MSTFNLVRSLGSTITSNFPRQWKLQSPLTSSIRKLSMSVEGLSAKEANQQLRIQLAAAHRGLAQFGLNDRVFNHMSVLSPAANGQGQVTLITPFPIDFADVTPQCLLGVNEEGDVVEGDGSFHQISKSFHMGFYKGDPSKRCMMHTHSPYICSMACLEDPTLKMINQTSAMIYKRVGYDMHYGGIVDDMNEGERVGKLMASGKHQGILLAHHGAVTAGSRVVDAFNLIVAMELSAMYQINAMQTGMKLVEINKDVLEKTYNVIEMLYDSPLAEAHLGSIITELAEKHAEFK